MKEELLKHVKNYIDVSDKELMEVIEQLSIKSFKKGTLLLEQGDIPRKCYFVLKGLIRQYFIDLEGNEKTFNFYTEYQTVAIFNQQSNKKVSNYYLSCLEDSILLEGDLDSENDMYGKYPFIQTMVRKMLEENIDNIRDEYANFIASTPQERYLSLLERRPGLAQRVPQNQLASYLGIKPESLSRIKKRVYRNHLKTAK